MPSSPTVIWAMTGRSGAAARAASSAACELLQVAEGLQDEPVHAALGQPARLAGEMGDRLAPARSVPTARSGCRAGRSRPPPRARPRAARWASAAAARLISSVRSLQPEGRELHRVGAEGVGLQDLGAGPDVRLVDLLHQAGLLEVQLVVADVDEHAAAVQHGAHRAVEDVDAAVGEELAEGAHGQLTAAYRRRAIPLVAQVRRQPALRLRHRHALPRGVVLHLVPADLADAEVARLRVPEVPAAHRRASAVIAKLSVSVMPALPLGVEQIEERRASRCGRGRRDSPARAGCPGTPPGSARRCRAPRPGA